MYYTSYEYDKKNNQTGLGDFPLDKSMNEYENTGKV